MSKTKLILRGSEWAGQRLAMRQTESFGGGTLFASALFQPHNKMRCCLGVDLSQRHGVDDEHLRDKPLPSDVVAGPIPGYMDQLVSVDVLEKIGDVDRRLGEVTRWEFTHVAAHINDAAGVPVARKVEALSILYDTIGVEVEYRPEE